MRRIAYLALAALMLMVLFVPMVSSQNGPEIDVLRYEVIRSPDAQLVAMQTDVVDVLTQRTRPSDIETLLKGSSHQRATVTDTLGFHISFIGFNIRANQSYRRPEITYWPLADVNFRHALAHSLDKQAILAGNNFKTPWNSMVPPIYDYPLIYYYSTNWVNHAVDGHPFNPGDPFATTIYNPTTEEYADSCSILRYGGYTFADAGAPGTVDDADYWLMPDETRLPELRVFSPRPDVDPQKWGVVDKWLQDCSRIGLAATSGNGNSGLIQLASDFWGYIRQVYEFADFDIFIVNFKLNRFPDYLYDWFHHSQDSLLYPSAYNPFGVNDPDLDSLLETLKFSLVNSQKVQACHDIQEWLADSNNQGLPVIPVYTMRYIDAFNPNLRGIVASPGFGAGDGGCVALKEPDGPIPSVWTYTNIHWSEETKPVVWCLSEDPESFNPLYAGTTLAWEVMDRVFDPLITVNPYHHGNVSWLATNWEIVQTAEGMNVTFYLRNDTFWQDGYQYTASDAEFSLEFIRDWQIWKYKPAWEPIVDVIVTDSTTFTVVSSTTSQFLIYDWAVLAALLPPQIWNRTWASQQAILDYDPAQWPYGTDMASTYLPGPWADQVPTNLFGTGPFIFQFYDPTGMQIDLWANENYFLTTQEIRDLKTEMFWEVGDVNRDGKITPKDIVQILKAIIWGPYNPNADFDQDGDVDSVDFIWARNHLGWQKEWP